MDNNYTEPELKVMLDDIDKIINKIKNNVGAISSPKKFLKFPGTLNQSTK